MRFAVFLIMDAVFYEKWYDLRFFSSSMRFFSPKNIRKWYDLRFFSSSMRFFMKKWCDLVRMIGCGQNGQMILYHSFSKFKITVFIQNYKNTVIICVGVVILGSSCRPMTQWVSNSASAGRITPRCSLGDGKSIFYLKGICVGGGSDWYQITKLVENSDPVGQKTSWRNQVIIVLLISLILLL